MNPEETSRLVEAYASRDMDPSEAEQLARVLRTGGEERSRVMEELAFSGRLGQAVSGVSSEAFAGSLLERYHAQGETDQFADNLKRKAIETREGKGAGKRAWLRIAAPLAAAAAVLIAVGLVIFQRSRPITPVADAEQPVIELDRGTILTVTRRVGEVDISRFTTRAGRSADIRTGANSLCRAEYRDGTLFGLADHTRVNVSVDRTTSGKRITEHSGLLYLDATRQASPFVVTMGKGQVELLGTQVLCAHGQTSSLGTVMGGFVKLTSGRTRVVARTGESFNMVGEDIWVSLPDVAGMDMSWLETLGVNATAVLNEAQRTRARVRGSLIDFRTYRVRGGTWDVKKEEDKVVIRQEQPIGVADIVFGDPRWKKGTVHVRFKMLKQSATSGVYVGFVYPQRTSDWAGLKKMLAPLKGHDVWVDYSLEFEIKKPNQIIIQTRFMVEGAPEVGVRESPKRPFNPGMAIKRKLCTIGLRTVDCAVEFRDLRLENAE